MNAFWLAVQFMTRLPSPSLDNIDAKAVGRSTLFYPLVGLIVGAILALFGWFTQSLDAGVAAALLLALWVWLSGALHLDGLADSADAWVGGQGDRERTLAIMKDPRCGPVGVVALVLLLLCKYAALVAILKSGQSVWILLITPMLGRAAVLALFYSTDYVRPSGLGKSQSEHLPRVAVPWILLFCALLTLLFIGASALLILLVCGLALLWLRRAMQQRIGGTTGDTAGALIEILEALVLIFWVWVEV